MSKDSLSNLYQKKGTVIKPVYTYLSAGVPYPMGSPIMYEKFILNYKVVTTANNTFLSEPGINLLKTMLNVIKCPLYVDIKKLEENKGRSEDELISIQNEYIKSIAGVFDILRMFINSLSNTGNMKVIYSTYREILANINNKVDKSSNLKGSPVEKHMRDLNKALNTSTRSAIGDISNIITNASSSDAAKQQIINSSTLGVLSKNFLSPVSHEVFTDFRQYCAQFIGEGTKLSDDSFNDSESVKRLLLSSLYLERAKFINSIIKHDKSKKTKTVDVAIELNHNSIRSINEVLSKILVSKSIIQNIIKIFNIIKKFYPEFEESFVTLSNIFNNDCTFERTYFKKIVNKEEVDDLDKYFGGSLNRESKIKKITRVIDDSVVSKPISEPITPPVPAPKPITLPVPPSNLSVNKPGKFFMGGDSSSDEESDVESDDETVEETVVYKTVEEIITIEINDIKNLIKFLSDAINPNDIISNEIDIEKSKEKAKETGKTNAKVMISTKERATANLAAVINGTFGESVSEFKLDWWQEEYLNKTRNGESFILVGDTSGGKTKVANLATKIQITKYITNSDGFIVFLAPTSQLAVQQFSSALKQYPEIANLFGLTIKSINNVPETTRILFGTPCEVERYLYPVVLPSNAGITSENISARVNSAISRPAIKNCVVLVIDESQVLSPTYVQEQEVEQKMECKAIENIIKTVSYEKNRDSQVILISATLSPESINNMKNKVSALTGIPSFGEIIYTFDDIGLSDKSKSEEHIPIMNRQLKYPIKVIGNKLTKFEIGETITEQVLNNQNIELVARDAMDAKTVPVGFYRESEISTIEMYKSFIRYLDLKNSECTIWFRLKNEYENERDIFKSKMSETAKILEWQQKISREINIDIYNVSAEQIHYGNIKPLINYYNKMMNVDLKSISNSMTAELYGLLYEFHSIGVGNNAFSSDIHPYYRFGNSFTSGDFFALQNAATKDSTILNKVLIAQDADPSDNTGGIIPLLLKGIKYGIGLITSTIPIGFQIEIFKYINVKSKLSGSSSPLQILFCEYGMTMGVNFNLMAVCMIRPKLSVISASEYKQTNGRSGRRGVSTAIIPRTYSFNVSNVYEINELENLSFDVSTIKSTFFNSGEVYDYFVNMIIKFVRNRDTIMLKEHASVEDIIFGDAFKELGGSDVSMVRKIQLAKYQSKEIFDICKNMFPSICDNEIRKIYNYLQKAEFYNLNVHIS